MVTLLIFTFLLARGLPFDFALINPHRRLNVLITSVITAAEIRIRYNLEKTNVCDISGYWNTHVVTITWS